MTGQDILTSLAQGLEITGEMATASAPIVSAFNPGAGAILAIAGPLAQKIAVVEQQMIITLNKDMTRDEVAKALAGSVSSLWPAPPSIALQKVA